MRLFPGLSGTPDCSTPPYGPLPEGAQSRPRPAGTSLRETPQGVPSTRSLHRVSPPACQHPARHPCSRGTGPQQRRSVLCASSPVGEVLSTARDLAGDCAYELPGLTSLAGVQLRGALAGVWRQLLRLAPAELWTGVVGFAVAVCLMRLAAAFRRTCRRWRAQRAQRSEAVMAASRLALASQRGRFLRALGDQSASPLAPPDEGEEGEEGGGKGEEEGPASVYNEEEVKATWAAFVKKSKTTMVPRSKWWDESDQDFGIPQTRLVSKEEWDAPARV